MLRITVSLFRSTHPLPSISVATFSVLLGVGIGLPAEKLILVGLAVLFQQFSVGLSNDWLDAKRDRAVDRADKPIAQGRVSPALVRNASFASGIIALLVSATLGVASLLWMIPMLLIGWAYNLGLKANALSVVPYIIGFGILPAFVTLSASAPEIPPVWVMVVAALLGIAAHFANVLPDLIEDKKTSVNALPHILGQRTSALVIAVSACSASLVLVIESTSLNPAIALGGLGLTVVLSFLASVLALNPKPPKLVFHLLIVASLVNVIMLMLS